MRATTLAAVLAAGLGLGVLAEPVGAQTPGRGEPIVGGGSFNDAPRIEPGTYSDTVVAKETNFYRVRLEKGQRLEVDATVDASQIENSSIEPGYDEGLAFQDYLLDIWTPIREPLRDEFNEAGLELEGDEDVGVYTGTANTRRTLGFDQVLASDYSVGKFEGPGDYYVEIAAQPDDSFDGPRRQLELPISFTIRVTGTVEPSSPDFAASLPKAPDDRSSTRSTGTPGGLGGERALFAAADVERKSDPVLVIVIFAVFALFTGLALGAITGLFLRSSSSPAR